MNHSEILPQIENAIWESCPAEGLQERGQVPEMAAAVLATLEPHILDPGERLVLVEWRIQDGLDISTGVYAFAVSCEDAMAGIRKAAQTWVDSNGDDDLYDFNWGDLANHLDDEDLKPFGVRWIPDTGIEVHSVDHDDSLADRDQVAEGILLYDDSDARIIVTATYPEWQPQTLRWDDEDVWYTLLDGVCYRTVWIQDAVSNNRLERCTAALFEQVLAEHAASNLTADWRARLVEVLALNVL